MAKNEEPELPTQLMIAPNAELDRLIADLRRFPDCQPVQSVCQIGSMLPARSPQSEQRNRRSNSLNPSLSAAPDNLKDRCERLAKPAVEQLLTTGPLNRDETSSARRCES